MDGSRATLTRVGARSARGRGAAMHRSRASNDIGREYKGGAPRSPAWRRLSSGFGPRGSDEPEPDLRPDDANIIDSALGNSYFVLVEHALGAMDRRVSTFSKFISATEGRDKMFKIMQYACKSTAFYLQQLAGGYRNNLADKLFHVASTCSLTRKYLKLLMQFSMARISLKVINDEIVRPLDVLFCSRPASESWIRRSAGALANFLARSRTWVKLLVVGRLVGLALYFSGDNVVWAIKTRILYDGAKSSLRAWQKRALGAQVLSCICALLLNAYQFWKSGWRKRQIVEKLELHRQISGYEIDHYNIMHRETYAQKERRLGRYLRTVSQKRHKLRVATFKLVLDTICAAHGLWGLGLNSGQTGIMSVMSAVVGSRLLWRRIKSGKFNPCASYTNIKKSASIPDDLDGQPPVK